MCICGWPCTLHMHHHLSSHLNSHPSMPTRTLPAYQPQMIGLHKDTWRHHPSRTPRINSPALFAITLTASFNIQSRDTWVLKKTAQVFHYRTTRKRVRLFVTTSSYHRYTKHEKRYNDFPTIFNIRLFDKQFIPAWWSRLHLKQQLKWLVQSTYRDLLDGRVRKFHVQIHSALFLYFAVPYRIFLFLPFYTHISLRWALFRIQQRKDEPI